MNRQDIAALVGRMGDEITSLHFLNEEWSLAEEAVIREKRWGNEKRAIFEHTSGAAFAVEYEEGSNGQSGLKWYMVRSRPVMRREWVRTYKERIGADVWKALEDQGVPLGPWGDDPNDDAIARVLLGLEFEGDVEEISKRATMEDIGNKWSELEPPKSEASLERRSKMIKCVHERVMSQVSGEEVQDE